MEDSDILLIKECQAGDISAFDKLVELHRKQVYHLAYQLTGSHEDADDISQEAFIQVYKSISKFEGKSRFSTWLVRIAINLSINHLKRESRHRHESHDEEVLHSRDRSLLSMLADNPLEDVEADELAGRIKEAMDSLPVAERVVFILRVHQGLSYKEIAQALSCPAGTVMSRLNRARRRLRDRLKDYII